MWSGRRIASTIAVGGLLLELGWAITDRIHMHLVDHGIRFLNR